MQGIIFDCKRGYKQTLWIQLYVVIYLLQVGTVSGVRPQSIIPTIPDSDETIIIKSTANGSDTSLLNTGTNVATHISDFIPKEKEVPKKVQSSAEKQTIKEKEKFSRPLSNTTKPSLRSTTALPEEFPPKHFPKEGDDTVPHKLGVLNKPAKKLLLNTKEENSQSKSIEASSTTVSHSEPEFPPVNFPKGNVNINNVTIPLLVNHNGAGNTSNIPTVFPTDNSTGPIYEVNKTSEAYDMTHSKKYFGENDLDDVKHIAEKLNKTKTDNSSELDPKSQVDVSHKFDKNGPKLLPANKNGGLTGLVSSTSNVVALSSAVLSSKPVKHETMLHPIKAIAATALTIVGMIILGMSGFLLWRRIIQRRFGHREMLINEDDFEEVSDLHHFQGTSPSTPNLVA